MCRIKIKDKQKSIEKQQASICFSEIQPKWPWKAMPARQALQSLFSEQVRLNQALQTFQVESKLSHAHEQDNIWEAFI